MKIILVRPAFTRSLPILFYTNDNYGANLSNMKNDMDNNICSDNDDNNNNTVKPVYNDHLMGYFSAFWSSSRWPPEGRNC